MQIYEVGGAVRDALLGRPVSDHDWVVVGATPEQMVAAGFEPVGKDFPVFLHPRTHEEHALARTERKSGRGYKGFEVYAAPEVTLEEDLARRDLTINAIARAPDGRLIDPYGGQRDIEQRVLRHVSPAFAEDPVRILRLARFAARFGDFTVAPETLDLCRQMVAEGEADHLVPERVWQEIARGLMEAHPVRLLQVLRDCGALARIAPELEALWGVPQPAAHHPEVDTGAHIELVLNQCVAMQAPLPVRFAALTHDLGKALTPAEELPRHRGHDHGGLAPLAALCARWKVPNDARELAGLACAQHIHVHQSGGFEAAAVQRLLQRCDALRRPERFAQLMQVCEVDARGRLGLEGRAYPQAERLLAALAAAQAVDSAAISAPLLAAGKRGELIGQAIEQARRAAIAATLAPSPGD
ncbi:multifunctional CCA addition/repair protein [Inhella proteolytica]|uniref:Multifunctional CCA protein n=1 Tax=Inhella proteolytica TaxID=2795029 RepID=A0A931J4P4_9BURK|nr:multifunctional CCA addition/repair protein [Inhella proteolytica]MBH9578216.1 multifunctional CCA addition/repair protein [Inhella proteolytica]